MTGCWRIGLLACSIVLVGACSAEGSDPDAGVDCQMPFEFASRTYSLVFGPEVGTVEPGRLLGTGRFELCEDGGGPGGDTAAVHALPDVPAEQAVVLLGERNRGAVYLSTEPPAAAWDADLLAVLDAWSVQSPKR